MARPHHHDSDSEDDLPEPSGEEIFGPHIPPPLVPLQAGPVALFFDHEWGFLRRFRVGGHEALRAIYPAVRTGTWKTVAPELTNVRIEQGTDRFKVTFTARHEEAATGIDFRWRGELTGEPDGTVTYSLDGEAGSSFETNRTGLCILHSGPDCAGHPLTVEHVDGHCTEAAFPVTISPHQPFFGIRAVRHEIAAGLAAKVTMDGDAFEMEDQRNWTDASFKTYGGPLANGIPLVLAPGQRVHHTVRFELIGTPPVVQRRDASVTLELPPAPTLPLPSLGTRWSPEAGTLAATDLDALRGVGLGHLLIDADVTSTGWRDSLDRALADVRSLDLRVWLRVVMTPNHQPALHELATLLGGSAERLLAVSVCSRVEPCPGGVTLALVRPIFSAVAPRVPLASAPLEHFADMNRFRPPADAWCAVPMCPQVHTFDSESMIENLQAQSAVLSSVRSFNPHPILVGPVSLTRRRQPDPRHRSLFCAAWTAGSLAQILPSGLAHAVAHHEHAGAMGIPGTPNEDVLGGFAGATRCAAVKIDDPRKVAALAVFDPDGSRRVLVANLTRESVAISIPAADTALEFGPYATAWLDV